MCITQTTTLSRKFGTKDKIPEQNSSCKEGNYFDETYSTQSQTFTILINRPFSYSENECGSNDISLQFVEFSNVNNCDRSSNGTQSSLVYKIV